MREIKSKAWDKEKHFWLNPEHFYITGEGRGFTCENSMGMYSNNYQYMGTERYAIERFTGLHDKNGKEIWIGDIYTYQQPLVKAGRQIYKEHHILVKDDIIELYYLSNRADSGQGIEVIGNINDNPELLE